MRLFGLEFSLKRVSEMRHQRIGTIGHWLLPRTKFDYANQVGDGLGSSTVVAPVLWVARNFPEAPILVERYKGQELEAVPNHKMANLIRRPNAHYSGRLLWMATMISYQIDGNAYWVKVRANNGGVTELWYVPHWLIRPKIERDSTGYIDYYEYRPGGPDVLRLDPSDVVHFRFGLDPRDTRRGLSPLASLLREIFTDDEAAAFTASILKNLGIPGILISPKEPGTISADEMIETKEALKNKFTGDKRGEPLVLSGPTELVQFGFNPQQMDLKTLRRIPEERVTAVFGIPAVVCGLGAGLDRCLPGSARVWTPCGPVAMRDVRPGMVVWSHKDGQLVPRKVTNWAITGKRRLYEIRTRNRTIKATDNHPFLVRVPGSSAGANHERHASCAWRRLDEIRPGDYIVQPRSLPDQGRRLLPDGSQATAGMLQFMGAVVGDGTVSPGVGVRIAMPPDDRCVGVYRELAGRLFTKYVSGGERPWKRADDGLSEQMVALHEAGESYHAIGRTFGMHNATVRDRILTIREPKPVVAAPVYIQERERDFGFSSVGASRWLADMGFALRAHTKRIPSWVWTLSRDLRLAFLAGLVDTDGHIDKRGALKFTFCNRELTLDVRDLLVSCGIQTSNVSRLVIPAANLPNPGRREEYEAWAFTVSSARSVAEIPFSDPVYRQRVDANPDRHRPDGFDSHKAGLSQDWGFSVVRAIEECEEALTYDIEVEDGHSFIADGVLVSNSTFSNFSEAREAAYESNIIPTQNIIADELHVQLLRDFESQVDQFQVRFDNSRVRILQEDEHRAATRYGELYKNGLIRRSEARTRLGFEAAPEDDIYFEPKAPADALGGMGKQARILGVETKAANNESEWKKFDKVRRAQEEKLAKKIANQFNREAARLGLDDLRADPESILAMIDDGVAEWGDLLSGSYVDIASVFAQRQAAKLGLGALDVVDYQALAEKWASKVALERVRDITDTTRELLRDAITRGVENGDSIPDIAQSILDMYDQWAGRGDSDIDATRAMRIARTETGMAANRGANEGAGMIAEDAGLQLESIWLATADDRTRETHAAIDGERVPYGEPFSNGLLYPGDPSGPLEETVNCRCAIAHQVVGQGGS